MVSISVRKDQIALAESFGGIARALLAEKDVRATLEQIVSEAIELIDPCEHAGIDILRGGRIEPLAPNSDIARRIHEIQVEVDQGPCLDAMRKQAVYLSGDLAEETRWPDFASRAFEETGIRSMIGFRLWTEEDTIGALDLYSTKRNAFDDETKAVGSVLAAHASVALASARKQEQLEEALMTRDLIGQAKGIVMERHRVGEDEAFALLREASQRLNVKLRDVARRFVDGENIVEF